MVEAVAADPLLLDAVVSVLGDVGAVVGILVHSVKVRASTLWTRGRKFMWPSGISSTRADAEAANCDPDPGIVSGGRVMNLLFCSIHIRFGIAIRTKELTRASIAHTDCASSGI